LDRQQAIKDQIARESFEYFKNKQMNHTENDQSMYKDYEDKEVLYTQSNEKIRSSSNKNFQPRHSNDFENSAKKKTGRNSQHKTLYNSNTKKKEIRIIPGRLLAVRSSSWTINLILLLTLLT
jgi:hypothetical protein